MKQARIYILYIFIYLLACNMYVCMHVHSKRTFVKQAKDICDCMYIHTYIHMCVYVCVCVCVCERERDRERQRECVCG